MRRFIPLLLISLFFAGCSDPIREGKIVDRQSRPAHEESYLATRYHYIPKYECRTVTKTQSVNGKSQTVTGQECGTRTEQVPYYVTEYRHVPDDWDIKIKSCHDDDGKEKCETAWIDVTHEMFDRAKLGMYYKDGELISSGDF